MKAYLGVDWSATEVECALGIGEVDAPRPIKGTKRTLDGVRELLERVRARAPGVEEVHVVIEAGAPGWVEMFHHVGAIVHVVDPKQAKKFAESLCSSGAKDDARDAAYQVALGRSARHLPPPWSPADPLREQLCELGAMHEKWSQDLITAQQRLRAVLRERLPALEQALPVLTREWALRVICAVPTALHAARVTEAQLQAVFKGSGARKTTRTAVIEAIRACRAPWLTAAVARVQELHVLQLVAQIELLSEQVANVEKELDALTRDLDIRAHLESVSGVGTKMANRLIQFAFDEVPEHRDQAAVHSARRRSSKVPGRPERGNRRGKP